jgi:NADH-quinone oxidoreductase subunit L
MVAAGVYLVGRMFEVFLNADPMVLQVVGIVGGITMFGAALLALVQFDIKKVLAYSTISQLAYMVILMSVGEAGRNAAFFHLFTHAFFKALLFLGAGSVIHAVHSNDMHDMGGLRTKMPITFWTFVIGSAALAGLPPLAGFWSKDELLVAASEGHEVVFALLLITAVITAFYTTRMVLMTFFGEYRGEAHPHESPASMGGPLIALAGATLTVGFLGAGPAGAVFFDWVFLEHPEAVELVPWVAALSIGAAVIGVIAGYVVYRRYRDPDPALEMGGFSRLLVRKYYLDEIYLRGIVYPIRDRVSSAVDRFNKQVLDGIVDGAARTARGAAGVVNWFDRRVIDGAVDGAGQATRGFGAVLRFIQTGNVQWYAVALFVGVIALTIVFVRIA